MAETKRDEAGIGQFAKERELARGVTLRHTLRGHTGEIGRIAWSPDGCFIASPSTDATVRIWNADTGEVIRTLERHSGWVYSVTWSPDGQMLASSGHDKMIRLWNAENGTLLRTLEGHRDRVFRVAWSPDRNVVASGSADNSIRLWDPETGKQRAKHYGHYAGINDLAWSPDGRRLASGSYDQWTRMWNIEGVQLGWDRLMWQKQGHTDFVSSLAWSMDGAILASGSGDKTIEIRNSQPGRRMVVLEGHTAGVTGVSFSADSQFLASKAGDGTVRLWRCGSWETVAVIEEPNSDWWASSIAFHPKTMMLATLGENDSVIRLWDMNLQADETPAAKAAARAIHHTTAKIVLVGDSGVGKTGLGWRLAHSEFREHASTHGQQFWVLNELSARRSDGTECEAILWDLAGQTDYRLIHALFLDDADLALLLFDSTDSRDPLHGVEFWLNQLKVGKASRLPGSESRRDGCCTILVGARVDRGTPRLTRGELEAFCHQRGVTGGYISTSAATGEGLEKLFERMKAQIPWEQKPATVTTSTFKRIKDYVLALKEKQDVAPLIVNPQDLRRRLEQTDPHWKFTDAEMMTAVGHLENYGYVKRLRTSKGEERVLLAPELLNNLAASFVLEARRNEKELGLLEETRLLAGEYGFREVEGLSPEERTTLLDAAALLFLEHHICFRETNPLNGKAYLVFPELINLKKPPIEEEKPIEDGVAYTVSGAVENIFSSLVVLLSYTHTFTRTNQWHNQARYEVGAGLVCGFRMDADAERSGELDFVLYFSTDTVSTVRKLFQSLFQSFLARRNLTFVYYEPVVCRNGHLLSRTVVRDKTREGKDFVFCNDCGEKLTLPKADEPTQLTRDQQAKVDAERRAAERRTRFEKAVFRLQAYVKEQAIKAPACFISYAWGVLEDERWVERNLAADLQKVGINVVLDRWEMRVGASVSRFIEQIEKCDRIIMVATPLYRRKYENKDTSTGYVVAAEVDLIVNRLIASETQKESVLPLLLAGEKTSSLPPLLHGRVYADFRNQDAYFTTAFDLILSLYQIAPRHPAVADLRESLQPEIRLS